MWNSVAEAASVLDELSSTASSWPQSRIHISQLETKYNKNYMGAIFSLNRCSLG